MVIRALTSTGNFRLRRNWRGKLILQAEFEGVATFRRHHDDIGYADTVRTWRDAKFGDIKSDELRAVACGILSQGGRDKLLRERGTA